MKHNPIVTIAAVVTCLVVVSAVPMSVTAAPALSTASPAAGADSLSINAPGTAASGTTVTLSFSMTNMGERGGARILDVSMPEGWTIVDRTDDGGSWKPGERKWLFQTVDAGDSRTPAVTVRIPDDASGSETVTATVENASGVTVTETRTVDVTGSTLTAGGAQTAAAGTTATVSFTARNTGTTDGARILDLSVPDGWTVVDRADDGGSWKPGEQKWLFQTVDAGDSRTPAVTVRIPDDAGGSGTVGAELKDDSGVTGTAARTVTLSSGALASSGPDTAAPGETVTVSFTATNRKSSADARILNLSAPEGWTIVDRADDGGSWKASEQKWLFQTVDAGDSRTPAVTMRIPDDASGTGTVGAELRDDSGVTGSTTQSITISDSQLTSTGPRQIEPGDSATISFTVQNPESSAGARILTVSTPEGWTVTDRTDDGGTWKASEQKWLFQTVDAGDSRAPSVTVTAPDNARGTATVSGSLSDTSGRLAATTQSIDVDTDDDDSGDGDSDGNSYSGGNDVSPGDGDSGDGDGPAPNETQIADAAPDRSGTTVEITDSEYVDAVTFDGNVSGTVTVSRVDMSQSDVTAVETAATKNVGGKAVSDVSIVSAVDISPAIDQGTVNRSTVELTVPGSAVAAADDVAVVHQTDDGVEVLDTSVTETGTDTVRLTAETDSFSVFSVVTVTQSDSVQTGTGEPTPSDTPDSAETSGDSAAMEGDAPTATTTGGSGPGFGAGLAIIAIALGGMVALRRRE